MSGYFGQEVMEVLAQTVAIQEAVAVVEDALMYIDPRQHEQVLAAALDNGWEGLFSVASQLKMLVN